MYGTRAGRRWLLDVPQQLGIKIVGFLRNEEYFRLKVLTCMLPEL